MGTARPTGMTGAAVERVAEGPLARSAGKGLVPAGAVTGAAGGLAGEAVTTRVPASSRSLGSTAVADAFGRTLTGAAVLGAAGGAVTGPVVGTVRLLFDEQDHTASEYAKVARRSVVTGAWGGAAGALAGSLFPVFGTAIGWVTGTVVGWMVDGMLES